MSSKVPDQKKKLQIIDWSSEKMWTWQVRNHPEEPAGEVSISDELKQSQHQHQLSSSSIPAGPVEV